MNGTLRTLKNFATKCDKEMAGWDMRNAEEVPILCGFPVVAGAGIEPATYGL
jgi:hypothetical protein